MAMTPYSGDTSVIGQLGTTPQERGLTTQQFKDKFDEGLKAFVEWFNLTHKTEFEADQAALATHKADNAAHGVSHKNLLHNWDFRNPVNQRGQNEYTGSGYAVDRWHILGNATATINNEYLSIKTNAVAYINFRQFIENLKAYYGKTLTFSVETADGQIYTKTVTLPTSGTVDTSGFFIGDWHIDLYATEADVSNNVFEFRFYCTTKADAIINLRRVKLELGSVSTLANDPPADYGEQLALCQRYYQKISRDPIGVGYIISTGTTAYIAVPTPVTMRTTPTLVGATAGEFRVRQNATDITPTALDITKYDNCIVLRFTVEGATAREIAGAYVGANIALSADL